MAFFSNESVWVYPCLRYASMQIATFLHSIILSCLVCLVLPHFPTLSHKRHDFRKKKLLLNIKWVLIFSTNFDWNIKLRSAPGHDGITPLMLRHLSCKPLSHLTHLFNHVLRLGYFPTNWKRAKVIPIPKPNKPGTNPNSYRPISLLSTLGKLFERILAARLMPFFNRQYLLPHTQFGFHKKHSTVSQLTRNTD
jgi:hypothetical protein